MAITAEGILGEQLVQGGKKVIRWLLSEPAANRPHHGMPNSELYNGSYIQQLESQMPEILLERVGKAISDQDAHSIIDYHTILWQALARALAWNLLPVRNEKFPIDEIISSGNLYDTGVRKVGHCETKRYLYDQYRGIVRVVDEIREGDRFNRTKVTLREDGSISVTEFGRDLSKRFSLPSWKRYSLQRNVRDRVVDTRSDEKTIFAIRSADELLKGYLGDQARGKQLPR